MSICKTKSPMLMIALFCLVSVTMGQEKKSDSSYQSPTINKGMTWGQLPVLGFPTLTKASCEGQPLINGNACDPVNGDTACSTELPILCINPEYNLLRPNYDVVKGQEHLNGCLLYTSPSPRDS